MHVSLEWLGQYVDIQGLSPHDIAEALTNSGLEVEGVHELGAAFTGVIVAKTTAIEPHPNADRLRLVTVNTGSKTLQVVCGAPNVRENMRIAFAKVGGQVVNRKEGGLFELTPAKIRGVESCGMVCSIEELGLQDKYPPNEEGGIWVIDDYVTDAQIGLDLKEALQLKGDTVLETAPTANRGDLMSLVGIAREIAALFDRKLTLPEDLPALDVLKDSNFKVSLPDTEVCTYYGSVLMKGLKIGPSPDWMAQRLEAANVRSISNVVDITNYVMLEMGQPLHAFDLNKLGGGEISVRRAKAGEKLVTLDSVERSLTEKSVLITKDDQPVALAGLMGGETTEIDDQSTDLFLEGAYFTPPTNRQSAKSVGLRTEATARFERGVDPASVKTALSRAAELLQEYAGAECMGLVEANAQDVQEMVTPLRLRRYEKIIGMPISQEKAVTILEKLGFEVRDQKVDASKAVTLDVVVPSYRQEDVTREIDLIEEIVRIVGYDEIPYILPNKTATVGFSRRQILNDTIRRAMSGQGLQEIVTNSLIGEALLAKVGVDVDRNKLVCVNNSHSSDHTLLRQSLMPNLLEIAKFNQAQGNEDVWVYELGRTYFKLGKPSEKSSGVVEKLCLGGLLMGDPTQGQWQSKNKHDDVDFYQAKGVVEQLFSGLQLGEVYYEAVENINYLHPGKSAAAILDKGNKKLGVLGQLHPSIQKKMKFRKPTYIFEVDVEALFKILKQQEPLKQLVRLSPYPAVRRDMAFWAQDTLTHRDVLKVLNGIHDPVVREIHLFDEYRESDSPKRSLAYRVTLQSDEDTLTDAQIDEIMKKLKTALEKHLKVEFR